MGWRVVDCTGLTGYVSAGKGTIIIRPDVGAPTTIPVADLAVVLLGVRTQFGSGTIHRLTAAGVAVLFCDWRGIPESAAYAWSDHSLIGARHLAQSRVSEPRKKALWANVIRAKVRGQAAVLEANGILASRRLSSLVKDVRSGDPSNIEGQAARVYWSALFPEEDFVRSPGCGFGRNACLDYGYAIVRGFGIRAVLAAGLNPTLGIYHRGRSNPFNLVDDLIEPFRPLVDATVRTFDEDASPHAPETRQALVASVAGKFSLKGATVPTELESFAQAVGLYFEGDINKVEIPQWTGRSAREQLDSDGR